MARPSSHSGEANGSSCFTRDCSAGVSWGRWVCKVFRAAMTFSSRCALPSASSCSRASVFGDASRPVLMALNKLCGSSERNLTSGGWDEASRSDPVGLSDIAMMVPAARVSALCDKMSRDPRAEPRPGDQRLQNQTSREGKRHNFDEVHETVGDNTYDFIWKVLETTSI